MMISSAKDSPPNRDSVAATPQGMSVEEFMRVVHRYAIAHGQQHGWPSFETVGTPGQGRVWGMFSWPAGSPQVWQADERGPAMSISALTPVAESWRAANRFANDQGYAAGMLTFESNWLRQTGEAIFGLMHLKPDAGLVFKNIPHAEFDSRPDFDRPDQVVRDVARWANHHGYLTGFPSFEQTIDPVDGRVFGAYLVPVGSPLGVSWRDVPETDLLGQAPPPPQPAMAISLARVGSRPFVCDVPAEMPGANREIAWYSISPPSTWNVDLLNVVHGNTTAVNVPR